jgi:hypothetical protein
VVFEIRLAELDTPRKLTQGVLQAAQLLGLYHAELARILGLQCADIGALANAQVELDPQQPAGRQAAQFIECYQLLFEHCVGDEACMCHWLRTAHPGLHSTPFLLMVDEGELSRVLAYLRD